MNASSTCSSHAGAICALVNSHCNSRARRRSNPSLTGARIRVLMRLARIDSCMSSSKSKCRSRKTPRSRLSSVSIALLSKVINSISGRIAVISLASSLPMIHVKRVCGHAACMVRSAATAWQVSPMAERRSRHTRCGAGWKVRVLKSIFFPQICTTRQANALPRLGAPCWPILPCLAIRCWRPERRCSTRNSGPRAARRALRPAAAALRGSSVAASVSGCCATAGAEGCSHR
jgi:hypothetical protein